MAGLTPVPPIDWRRLEHADYALRMVEMVHGTPHRDERGADKLPDPLDPHTVAWMLAVIVDLAVEMGGVDRDELGRAWCLHVGLPVAPDGPARGRVTNRTGGNDPAA